MIVEAAVPGREIECGVLAGRDGGLPEASLPAEIRLRPGTDWYDFAAKYLDDAVDFDVPGRPRRPEQTAAVQEAARRAFLALDCRGPGPGRLLPRAPAPDGSDRLVINEVNTMPGFTPISMFPRMWAASGVGYPELVDRLVTTALARLAASPVTAAARPHSGGPSCSRSPPSCAATGCAAGGRRAPAGVASATRLPGVAGASSGALIVTEVPSGLPRLPDDELRPAGRRQAVEDVAALLRRPGRASATVLAGLRLPVRLGAVLGRRESGPMTGVFVDQFDRRRRRRPPTPPTSPRNDAAALRRRRCATDPPGCPRAAGCSPSHGAASGGRAARPGGLRLVPARRLQRRR